MNVAYKSPGEPAKAIEIGDELEDLQKAVGGYIEVYTLDFAPERRNLLITMNEEGRLQGLKVNVFAEMYGDLLGSVFICAKHRDDMVSLSPVEMSAAIKWLDERALDPAQPASALFSRVISFEER